MDSVVGIKIAQGSASAPERLLGKWKVLLSCALQNLVNFDGHPGAL